MTKIKQHSMEDVCEALPEVRGWDPTAIGNVDLLITALGFEERCHAIPRDLAESGAIVSYAAIITVGTNVSDNESNRLGLMKKLRQAGASIEFLDGDSSRLELNVAECLCRCRAARGSERARVAIDSSVMASRVMMRVIAAMLAFDVHLRVLYATAERYHPTEVEFFADQEKYCSDGAITIEEGVEAVSPSASHAGQHLDPLPACVVLFPNFRKERSRAVISSVDESLLAAPTNQIVWMLTRPFKHEYEWRLKATMDVNGILATSQFHLVDAMDFRDTMLHLEKVYSRYWRTHNISISPLGTKMQRLGVALFNAARPSTRLVHSAPKRYSSSQWSTGVGEIYTLEFSSLSATYEDLRRVDELKLV